jgi:hypothetical protein
MRSESKAADSEAKTIVPKSNGVLSSCRPITSKALWGCLIPRALRSRRCLLGDGGEWLFKSVKPDSLDGQAESTSPNTSDNPALGDTNLAPCPWSSTVEATSMKTSNVTVIGTSRGAGHSSSPGRRIKIKVKEDEMMSSWRRAIYLSTTASVLQEPASRRVQSSSTPLLHRPLPSLARFSRRCSCRGWFQDIGFRWGSWCGGGEDGCASGGRGTARILFGVGHAANKEVVG